MIVQKQITLRVHAEIKMFTGGGWDVCVMAGKRCIDQQFRPSEKESREYLADTWGLDPTVKK